MWLRATLVAEMSLSSTLTHKISTSPASQCPNDYHPATTTSSHFLISFLNPLPWFSMSRQGSAPDAQLLPMVLLMLPPCTSFPRPLPQHRKAQLPSQRHLAAPTRITFLWSHFWWSFSSTPKRTMNPWCHHGTTHTHSPLMRAIFPLTHVTRFQFHKTYVKTTWECILVLTMILNEKLSTYTKLEMRILNEEMFRKVQKNEREHEALLTYWTSQGRPFNRGLTTFNSQSRISSTSASHLGNLHQNHTYHPRRSTLGGSDGYQSHQNNNNDLGPNNLGGGQTHFWFLDAGASHHVSRDKSIFSSLKT